MRASRGLVGLTAAGLVIGTSAVLPAGVARAVSVARQAPTMASAQAAATGEPVEVIEARDEYSQTFANPDGTFTLTQSAAPKRAKAADGSWHDLDETLVRRGDGRIGPRYAVADVSFSAGGDGSGMLALNHDGHALKLGWPGPLPAPTLDGPVAVYPGVLPDVDLQLTATAEGYRQVLVVHTAEAANSSALARIRLGLTSEDLKVVPGIGGGLRALDADGNAVFSGPAGQMWDSTGDTQESVLPAAAGSSPEPTTAGAAAGTEHSLAATDTSTAQPTATPTSTDPAPGDEANPPEGGTDPVGSDGGVQDPSQGPSDGDQSATLPVQVTSTSVTVVPDSALLTGEDTVFPVYIDPPVGLTLSKRLMLGSNGEHDWQFTGTEGVGKCGTYAGSTCGSGYVKRLFFEFSPSKLSGKYVLDATFRAYETWSMSCTASWVNLGRADGSISDATRWPGPGSVDLMGDRYVSAGRGNACNPDQPPAWIEFNDNPNEPEENLTSTVRNFANGKWPRLTLLLRANDETNANGWKRFRNDAELQVTYAPKPGVPTGTGVQPTNDPASTTCKTSSADAVTVASATPTVRATVQTAVQPASGEDRGLLQAEFEVDRYNPATNSWVAKHWTDFEPDSGWDPDGTVESTVTSTLADTTTYRLRTRTQSHWTYGTDGDLWSGYSSWCYFKVDSSAPKPPTVSGGAPYTECAPTSCLAAGGPGVPGTFTFQPDPADTNVSGYRWRLLSQTASTTKDGGSLTEPVTPQLAGTQQLSVEAKDIYNRYGPPKIFTFQVEAAAEAIGSWQFADPTGTGSTTAADTATGGVRHPLSLAGGAVFDAKGRRGNLPAEHPMTTRWP